MALHLLLTIFAMAAGRVDFTHDSLPSQCWILGGFHDTDEFVPQDAIESEIASGDFKVSAADTTLDQSNQTLFPDENRFWQVQQLQFSIESDGLHVVILSNYSWILGDTNGFERNC